MKLRDISFLICLRKLVPVIFLLLLYSCITHKDLEYLQDKDKGIKMFSEAGVSEYLLKPADELYIQVSSLDDASSNIFTVANQQLMSVGTIQPYGASLLSYTIDREGYLLLPVIGRLYVKDKTITQVSEMLKDHLTNILSQPVVSVKLVNRFISVLGEVRTPGHFSYTQDKITIFDAIGLAGDMTDFGSREKVILVRNEEGKNLRVNLNLTSSDILNSEYYYLRPNDIIYIMPSHKKFWNMSEFPYSIILATITTSLLIYATIQNY